METFINKLNHTFKNNITYKSINNINNVQLRKSKINLIDLIYYQFEYSVIGKTKNSIISQINLTNNENIHSTCFLKKQNNISLNWYNQLFSKISNLCDEFIYSSNNASNKINLIGFDGTYSNDSKQNISLNLGIFDITNKIPINLVFEGVKNRNKEISCATKFIKNNVKLFEKSIIVMDRGYFSYNFIDFLIEHNINFIIRARNNVKILKRNDIKYVRYNEKITKTSFLKSRKRGESMKKITYSVNNECILITNIKNQPKNVLLEMYRSRWEIETYFKFIKSNFKIQHTKEKNTSNVKKIFICSLILSKILATLKHITKNNNINNTNLMNGLIEPLFLKKLLSGTLDMNFMNTFCKIYIKKSYNKCNRHFPRISRVPFTKWYVKNYSINAEINEILEAILNNKINELHKNKKIKALKIDIIK